MATRQTSQSADDEARQIIARRAEAVSYLQAATVSGNAADIDAWQSLIRKFDRQLAQYGRTWN